MFILLILCAAVLYVSVFLTIGFRHPKFALVSIFASAPFVTDISGGGPLKFSLAEVNLLLSIPILMSKGQRIVGRRMVRAGIIYIAVGVACSLLSWRGSTLMSVVQMGIYLVGAVAVFAMLARAEEDYRTCFNGYILVACFLAAAVSITGSSYIFGIHKNNCGGAISAGFLIALEMCLHAKDRRWRRIYQASLILLGIGLIISVSRGSWLGAVTGAAVIFLLRRQFTLMLRSTIALCVLVAVAWSFLPKDTKNYALGFEKDRGNIQARYDNIDFALEQFWRNPFTGVGVGLRKEYDATNLFLLILAETGVVGLFAFLLLKANVAGMIWRSQRKLSRSSFSFSILAIAAALVTGKLAHAMVDHYWVRGTLMTAWASVGMAAWVARQRLLQRRLEAQQRNLQQSIRRRPGNARLTYIKPSAAARRHEAIEITAV